MSAPAETQGGSGWLKRGLSLFVEVEPAQPASAPVQAVVPPPPPTVGKGPVSISPVSTGVNNEMLQAVRSAAYQRTSPFKTLLDTAERFRAVIDDDRKRLQAAFLSVNSDGQRSVQSITDCIKLHIQDVEGERLRFKQHSDNERRTKVDQPRAAAQSQRADIEAKTQQVARLQQEINELSNAAATLDSEANQAEVRINSVEQQFNLAADTVVRELTQQQSDLTSVLAASK